MILKIPVEKGFSTFPEFLLAGLLPWMAIQEGISRASTALMDNASMVKKTVFPVETLVLSVVFAAVVNEVIAFVIYAGLSRLARAPLGPVAPARRSPALAGPDAA